MFNIYDNYTALEYRFKNLSDKLEEFENGERYQKIQNDYKKVIAGYSREIKSLKKEVESLHKKVRKGIEIWFYECQDDWDSYQEELAKKDKEIERLENKYWDLLRRFDEERAILVEKYEAELEEKNAIIAAIKDELAHAYALLNRDGTNTSLSTRSTPPGKNKVIPNGRESTGKLKGGQPGHEKHILEKPDSDEITDEVKHNLDDDTVCPNCHCDEFEETEEYEEKYEYEIAITVKKILHKFTVYRCAKCGQKVRCGVSPRFHSDCQYGPNLQALALSMMNTTNASINKVRSFIIGATNGDLHPSEAYISGLQKKAAKRLSQFREDLKNAVIDLPIIYWDDTVISIDKTRGCLRFYGNEKLAYYVGRQKKDLKGVLEDGILQSLKEDQMTMHDHNSINYNKQFRFKNLECNIHLQRDLQKNYDNTQQDTYLKIKNLISKAIHDRKELLKQNITRFSDDYIEQFYTELDKLLDEGEEHAKNNSSKYSGQPERAIIRRLKTYRDNYFGWIKDFNLPYGNNVSERSLRGAKSKMSIAGQFESVKYADYYAIIRSYIETCRRNGINEMIALQRLCNGNPYTIDEILAR